MTEEITPATKSWVVGGKVVAQANEVYDALFRSFMLVFTAELSRRGLSTDPTGTNVAVGEVIARAVVATLSALPDAPTVESSMDEAAKDVERVIGDFDAGTVTRRDAERVHDRSGRALRDMKGFAGIAGGRPWTPAA